MTLTAPIAVHNPARRDAIDYRMGTFARFRSQMLRAAAAHPDLEGWTARTSDDYGVAIVEMWAYVGDVLTFYQERIANEAFLRTADEFDSILRLAALLDYRPTPGRAAEAELTATIDRDREVLVDAGLVVQSVPAGDGSPEKFVIDTPVDARAAVNRVRVHPRPEDSNPFEQGSTHAHTHPGDLPADVRAGADVLLFDAVRAERKSVEAVTEADGLAEVAWAPPVQAGSFDAWTARLVPAGRALRLFGHNAPASFVELAPAAGNEAAAKGGPANTLSFQARQTDWELEPAADGSGLPRLPLDGRYDSISPGSRVLLVRSGDDGAVRVANVAAAAQDGAELGQLADSVTWLSLGLAVAAPVRAWTDGTLVTVADDSAVWARAGDGTWASLGGRAAGGPGSLATAVHPSGGGELAVAGDDGQVRRRESPSSGWEELSRPDGRETKAVAVAPAGDGFAVVALTDDGSVHAAERSRAGAYGDWRPLGTPAAGAAESVAAASAAGRLTVAALASDGTVALLTPAAAPAEPVWRPLGAPSGDSVAILRLVADLQGRLSVVALTRGGQVQVSVQPAAGAAMSAWISLDKPAGAPIAELTAAADGAGAVTVAARAGDGKLWTRRRTVAGQAAPWQALPPLPAGGERDLALTPASSGLLALHAGAADGALWRLAQAGSGTWTGSAWTQRGWPLWPIPDRRAVTVMELGEGDLRPWTARFPATIDGTSVYVAESDAEDLDRGRRVMLIDAAGDPQTVTVAGTAPGDGAAEGLVAVDVSPAIAPPLDSGTAVLLGNVVHVTHGRPVAEVLGSGDAAASFQTFRLAKAPVTFVARPGAPRGIASTLVVRVDGVEWRDVETLYGQDASAQVYTTRLDPHGAMEIRFGDGRTGARLPTGRDNVTASYRVGLGTAGNVAAGSLTNPLGKPAGLKSVTNPVAAEGGAEPESIEDARVNAPNTVRTFGRIVSLTDFEDAARELPGIAKARATWVWVGEERAVQLVVAGDDGHPIGDLVRSDLVADLDARRDPNRRLIIPTPSFDPLAAEVVATVDIDPAYRAEDVQAAARAALLATFDFALLDFGRLVALSEVYRALQTSAGVRGARVERLRFKDDAARAARAGAGRAVQDVLAAGPGELIVIDDPDTDVRVTAR